MNKRIRAWFLLITIFLSALSVSTPLSSANPIAITQAPTGGLFSTNQSLQLIEAHVEILIQPHRINISTFHQNVLIYGNYSIFSPISVNTTIAFAYPTVWRYQYYGSTPEVSMELDLHLNGTSVEYQTLDFADLEVNYSLILEDEYSWIYDEESQLSFAAFDATVSANTSLFLEVIGSIESTILTDVSEFSYCVGTGRTWSGNTYETVEMKIENYAQYLSVRFNPNTSLTVSTLGDNIVGNWDLNLTEFENNYVSVQCEHRSWDYTPPGLFEEPSSPVFFMLVFGLITMVVITAVLIRKSRIT